jgi:hypothetical protein
VADGDGALDEPAELERALASGLGTGLGRTVGSALAVPEHAPASTTAAAASDQIRREGNDILTVTPRCNDERLPRL